MLEKNAIYNEKDLKRELLQLNSNVCYKLNN